jgi:hypothetical protein
MRAAAADGKRRVYLRLEICILLILRCLGKILIPDLRFDIRMATASTDFDEEQGMRKRKIGILSRLEVGWEVCFVGDAGNSNRGVSIRMP